MRSLTPSTAWLALALACALGCGDSGPPPQLVLPGLELVAVSPDQSIIASHFNLTYAVGSAVVGDLLVSQLSPPLQQLKLDEAAFQAAFPTRQGGLLTYLTNATPSIDAGAAETYGALWAWLPGFPSGVRLSTGFAVRTLTASDGSWSFFVDAPQASRAVGASVGFVQTGACRAASATPPPPGEGCPVHLLAQGQLVFSLVASLDDRFLAWTQTPGGAAPFAVQLLDTRTLAVQQVATSPSNLALAFSLDGSLLALGTRPGEVLSTQTGAQVPWVFPQGVTASQLGFADAQTLLLRGRDKALYRTGPAAASTLLPAPVLDFSLPRGLLQPSRYLLFETAAAADGTNDAQLLDLQPDGAQPVLLSSHTVGLPALSDDLGACAFLDSEDPSTKSGRLTVLPLPGGAQDLIALQGSAIHSWGFAPGSGRLLFIDPANEAFNLREWRFGHLASRLISSSVLNWRARPGPGKAPGTVYFTYEGDTSGSIEKATLP